MLKDEARTQTYMEAIKKNGQDLTGKVVMDLGTGTGILSFFCVAAGAAKGKIQQKLDRILQFTQLRLVTWLIGLNSSLPPMGSQTKLKLSREELRTWFYQSLWI
jgi:hypothetical protein